ncbi:MAG: hypothetical protein J0L92_20345 [Deltaproteobacteria bacterium]|nr:hypothetical protein [Deltaproteobacteria bacterium]
MRSSCALALGVGLVLAVVSGCRTPTTQVLVSVQSTCGTTPRTLFLTVTGSDGAPQSSSYRVDRWPYIVVLSPRDQDVTRRHWRLVAELGDGTTRFGRSVAIEGDYEAQRTLTEEFTVFDPTCSIGDAGTVDAASLDAASLDAASLDAASLDAASLDAASLDAGRPLDAASMEDAGTRSIDGLLLAYPFAPSDLANECGRGADLDLSDAIYEELRGGGMVLRGGHAVSEPLTDAELTQLETGFSIELWASLDPSLSLVPDARQIVTLYDAVTWQQTLRLSAGAMTDASAYEILAGVRTVRTGDSYGRPFLAARVADRFTTSAARHVVYTYTDGDEHLYVDGREAVGADVRWELAGGGTAPPRPGAASLGTPDRTRLWLGNSPSLVCRPPDAGPLDARALDAGCVLAEQSPDPSAQFRGTYRMLVLYGRTLTASEVAQHHGLGAGSNPCVGL